MKLIKKLLIWILLLAIVGLIYFFFSLKQISLNAPSKQKDICLNRVVSVADLSTLENFSGKSKPVDFSDFPEARTFYTRITKSVKEGPNFAKHFNLIYWGCGTDCFGYAVVDSNTGKVIAYSPANAEYHLRGGYHLDDNYFVMDPVHAGQERRFYQIVSHDGKEGLEVVCTETSQEEMYQMPEN